MTAIIDDCSQLLLNRGYSRVRVTVNDNECPMWHSIYIYVGIASFLY